MTTVDKNDKVRLENTELQALESDTAPADGWATVHDLREMHALRLPPTFRRRFKLLAMVGFSSTVVAAWPNVLSAFQFALYNGGTGGFFWTFVFSMAAMVFVYLSLSELSSMFPTAGGQYQWVVRKQLATLHAVIAHFLIYVALPQAECAPSAARRLLSYCSGWLLVLGWQTWLCSCGVIIGDQIKYCILLYHPDSAPINSLWFPSLLALIVLIAGGCFNLYCTKRFPILESIFIFVSLASWLSIVVTLWVTSPRGDPSVVLFTFDNGGGWSSAGGATLVGIITAWGSVLGYDSSVHMTENAKDASRTIPFSLMTAYIVNSAMAFIMGVTTIFCAGNLQEVLANTDQAPFVLIFYNSTRSKAATVMMVMLVMLMLFFALVSQVATASRQLWSFARDGGLPFGAYIIPVHDAEVPRRAVCLTMILSCAFASINFGTVAGFNAVVSLAIVAVTASYTICIGALIVRRIRGPPLPKERFALGAWGLPINIVALACTMPITVLSVFPSEPLPTPAYMNWAILVFGVIAVFSAVYYAFVGRRHFHPPTRKD